MSKQNYEYEERIAEQARANLAQYLLDQSTLTATKNLIIPRVIVVQLQGLAQMARAEDTETPDDEAEPEEE